MAFQINPRIPMGMPEFAALYAAEGATPEAAESNIHLNYPMEVKSLLDKRWSALGTGMSPGRYFATAANRPRTSSMVTPEGKPVLDRNPTFATEAERNLAIASGAYDPAYASPHQRMNHQALKAIGLNDRNAIRAEADRLEPIRIDEPEDLIRSQLMGDTIGLQKKILARQSASRPMTMGTLAPLTAALQPYSPEAGYGALGGGALPSRLDRRIYNDPDFQEAIRSNPEEAAYAYQRLTGRSLDKDLEETVAIRKTQVDTGRKYAQSALAQGANFDKNTGKWKVWNMAEPEEGIGLSQPRANRMFVDATPEQSQWLNDHYEAVTGSKLKRQSPEDRAKRNTITQNVMGNDPAFLERVKAKEATMRRSLTNEELSMEASDLLKERSSSSPYRTALENNEAVTKSVGERVGQIHSQAWEGLLNDLGITSPPEFDMSQSPARGTPPAPNKWNDVNTILMQLGIIPTPEFEERMRPRDPVVDREAEMYELGQQLRNLR